MSESRCELTDLLTSECAHCRGELPARPKRGRSIDMDLEPWIRFTTPARYEGRCYFDDDHRTHVGENVGRVRGPSQSGRIEDLGWACQECIDEMGTQAK